MQGDTRVGIHQEDQAVSNEVHSKVLPPGWWTLRTAAKSLGVDKSTLKKRVYRLCPDEVERRLVSGTWCLCAPSEVWRRVASGHVPKLTQNHREAIAKRRLAAMTPRQRMMLRLFILAVMRGHDLNGLHAALRNMRELPQELSEVLVGRRAV